MFGETPAPNYCRFCGEEVNELNGKIIKIKQIMVPKTTVVPDVVVYNVHVPWRKGIVKKDRIVWPNDCRNNQT